MNKTKSLIYLSIIGMALITTPILHNGGSDIDKPEFAAPGMVAYAASYSSDPTNEPQYSTQNSKTFQYLNLGQTHDYYRGDSVKVGIIDSGINYDHEDFMVNSQTKVKGDSKYYEYQTSSWVYYKASQHGYSYIDDSLGHGTNVAATVAAAVNSIGGVGLAPNVELYVYKVTNSNNGYEFGAIQNALMDAKTLGLDVINMSFQSYEHAVSYGSSSMAASSGCSTILSYYLNQAYNAGITLVGAAGNYNTSEPSYPGSNNHVINVGSLNQTGTDKAGFSNYGSTIDLVAPGYVRVADKGTNSSYKDTSGTSFSAPLVTAAIALYKQQNPSATPAQIESALYASCDPIDDSGSAYTNWAGNGALNVAKFLGVDVTDAPTSIDINNPEVVDEELSLEIGDHLDLDWTVNGVGTFDDSVNFYTLSGDDNVVSIDSNGRITATGFGTDYVVIESNADSSIYASIYVTVTSSGSSPTVSSVTISPANLALDLNGTTTGNLSATVNGTNNPSQSVSWSSSNISVATVSALGVVTAKKVGSTTITATSLQDGTKSGTCSVTVSDSTPVLSSISVNNPKTSFDEGSTFVFGGTVTAHFNNSSDMDVTSLSSFSGYDMNTPGNQTVTVSYTYGPTTKTTTYSIEVIASSPSSEPETVTYTVSTKTSASITSGEAPDGSSITFNNNGSNNADQMTSGKKETWTLKGYEGCVISSFLVRLHKNSSSGSGTASMTNDGSTVALKKSTYSSSDLTSSYKSYEFLNNDLEVDGDIVLTLTSTANSFWCDSIIVTYQMPDMSDKIIDSLSASYTGSTIYVGDSLDESAVVVTASYTDSTKYPDSTLGSKFYLLNGFSSINEGLITITVTYIGPLETTSSPMTTSFTVNIVVDTVTNVSISDNTIYHPGDTINKSDITLNATYASGKGGVTTDFTFANDGYQFTYSDANSGGSNTNKTFTNAISFNGELYSLTVIVNRNAYTTPSTTTTTLTSSSVFKDIGGSNSNLVSGTVTSGGIMYEYSASYYYSTGKSISFGNASTQNGYVTNQTAFTTGISEVTVSSTGRTINIRYSIDGSSWVLKSSADTTNNDYKYFKLDCVGNTGSNYSNITTITIKLKGADNPTNVANYIMYEDTNNQCTTKLDLAIDKLNTMSSSDKETFWTSNNYVITNARERLNAWARHEGKELTYNNGSYQASGANSNLSILSKDISISSILIVIAVSTLGLISISGYFLLKRKKK